LATLIRRDVPVKRSWGGIMMMINMPTIKPIDAIIMPTIIASMAQDEFRYDATAS
jgi:hypothetical protein